MLPEVMEAVTGGRFRSQAAVLRGFARYQFKRRVYPGLIKQDNGHVNGVLYLGIDARSLTLLDRFEAHYYKRKTITIESETQNIQCEAYIVSRNYVHLLSKNSWDVEDFRNNHLAKYLEEMTS